MKKIALVICCFAFASQLFAGKMERQTVISRAPFHPYQKSQNQLLNEKIDNTPVDEKSIEQKINSAILENLIPLSWYNNTEGYHEYLRSPIQIESRLREINKGYLPISKNSVAKIANYILELGNKEILNWDTLEIIMVLLEDWHIHHLSLKRLCDSLATLKENSKIDPEVLSHLFRTLNILLQADYSGETQYSYQKQLQNNLQIYFPTQKSLKTF